MLKINNIELELDLYDADVMDNFTRAMEKIDEKEKSKSIKGLSNGEVIRQECEIIFDFFNDVFGAGTDKTIFGDKTNIKVCLDAFKQVVEYAASVSKDLAKLCKIK
jgi:hypothetical protein